MKRLVGYGVGLLTVVLLMFFPAVFAGGTDGDASEETATITDYKADFEVSEDGTLTATETLTVDFPLYKHGIFRFFDLDASYDSHVRLIPEDISVTRDGKPDGLDLSKQGRGRYVVARIGEECCTITGEHTYVITYKVDGVLTEPLQDGGDGSTFYWNLIPGGWLMPIEKATLTATLPDPPDDVQCAIGNGSSAGCEAKTDGDTITVTTGRLEPNTPVTVQAPIATAYPGEHTLPWAARLDPVFGRSVVAAVVFALLALGALVGGFLLARSVREEDPAFPLQYAPPEGIGPAQGAYLLTERVDDDAYAATMLQLGEKGLASLDRQGAAWTITGLKGDWNDVDAITGQTAAELGISGEGTHFTAQPDDVDGGKLMQEARTGFDGAVKDWARTNGLMEFPWLPGLGAFGVIGSGLLAAYLFLWNPANMSLTGLPFAVFAVMGLPLLDSGAGSFRTKSGRDAWSRLGGFRRVLGTTSSEARFDFSGRKELYTAYIPWAVAFGVADVWAQKYRVEMQEEPPAPAYFVGGYAPTWNHDGFNDFSDSFTSSVSSAISAYQATQASSSSGGGGGGFSGGGGGGGGGGGSW